MVDEFLNEEQEKTFENLKKPIISLVGTYYPMSCDVMDVFASIMAIYESNPTSETMEKVKNILNATESSAVKKARLLALAAKVLPSIRNASKKKYLEGLLAVPAGMPKSGDFLSALGVVSDKEKECLIETQAAVRILDNFQNCGMRR